MWVNHWFSLIEKVFFLPFFDSISVSLVDTFKSAVTIFSRIRVFLHWHLIILITCESCMYGLFCGRQDFHLGAIRPRVIDIKLWNWINFVRLSIVVRKWGHMTVSKKFHFGVFFGWFLTLIWRHDAGHVTLVDNIKLWNEVKLVVATQQELV